MIWKTFVESSDVDLCKMSANQVARYAHAAVSTAPHPSCVITLVPLKILTLDVLIPTHPFNQGHWTEGAATRLFTGDSQVK